MFVKVCINITGKFHSKVNDDRMCGMKYYLKKKKIGFSRAYFLMKAIKNDKLHRDVGPNYYQIFQLSQFFRRKLLIYWSRTVFGKLMSLSHYKMKDLTNSLNSDLSNSVPPSNSFFFSLNCAIPEDINVSATNRHIMYAYIYIQWFTIPKDI